MTQHLRRLLPTLILPIAVTAGAPAWAAGESLLDRLPRNLSPWGMFLGANMVVQAVLVGLLVASLLVWTVWFAKSLELFGAIRALRRGIARLAVARTLDDTNGAAEQAGIIAAMLRSAASEVTLSAALPRDGLKERVALRIERLDAAERQRRARGTGLLATIGATAPFVGLFGTVWGIMNSFVGISEAQTTNLAVVAPGIAEALLATAFGLVAAIPAVVMYNLFARALGGYRLLLADAASITLQLVSRDVDRQATPRARAAE